MRWSRPVAHAPRPGTPGHEIGDPEQQNKRKSDAMGNGDRPVVRKLRRTTDDQSGLDQRHQPPQDGAPGTGKPEAQTGKRVQHGKGACRHAPAQRHQVEAPQWRVIHTREAHPIIRTCSKKRNRYNSIYEYANVSYQVTGWIRLGGRTLHAVIVRVPAALVKAQTGTARLYFAEWFQFAPPCSRTPPEFERVTA